ncbi:MAG: HNH endonuclease [Pseudomonadota bacterium]
MNYSDFFYDELRNPNTNFFILDSKGDSSIGDIDFEKYSWHRSKYNKVNVSDLAIFRRPSKASETYKFYFYGAAKIGQISGIDGVTALLKKPYPFVEHIHMEDVEHFKWKFKNRNRSDWMYFFNQYGMNQINLLDFHNLMKLADGDVDEIDPEAATEAHQDIQRGNYSVDDKEGKVKIRVKHGVFSSKVKDQYKVSCAICGIKTRSFLIGSHIIPWSADKTIRLDPSNGICLCTFHDKAFDQGYFTLDDDLKIRTSKSEINDEIIKAELSKIDGLKLTKPTINSPQKHYLKFHRDKVFEKFIK